MEYDKKRNTDTKNRYVTKFKDPTYSPYIERNFFSNCKLMNTYTHVY